MEHSNCRNKNPLRRDFHEFKVKLRLDNLHDAIWRDLCLQPDEIHNVESDFYHNNIYIKCVNRNIVEQVLERCQGNLVYCTDFECNNLPVSLEVQESMVVEAWILQFEIDDETVRNKFS